MKEYDLVFCFDRTGKHTFVRTMPDGHNAGLLNGLGGRSSISTMNNFFDDVGSGLIGNVHVMDVVFKNGCTPDSENEPITLHIEGRVYNELKLDDTRRQAGEIKCMETIDALFDSIENEENEFALAVGQRKYVRGYEYFMIETYDAIVRMNDSTGQFPNFCRHVTYH